MAIIFASGDDAVVTHIAIAIDTSMIKVAIHVDIDKTGGVVAVIAFHRCLDVMAGFANGQHTVVAFAALTKCFLVIHKAEKVKAKGGMTGLTHIGGRKVVRRFGSHRWITAIVTIRTQRWIRMR